MYSQLRVSLWLVSFLDSDFQFCALDLVQGECYRWCEMCIPIFRRPILIVRIRIAKENLEKQVI